MFWNFQNLLQFLRTNCRNHPSHTIRIAIPEYLCYPIHKWLCGFETILAEQLYTPWNDCRSIPGNSKEHQGEPTGVNCLDPWSSPYRSKVQKRVPFKTWVMLKMIVIPSSHEQEFIYPLGSLLMVRWHI